MTDLAKRLLACPRFRWMPGMLTACKVRVLDGTREWVYGRRPGPTLEGGGWVDTLDVDGLLPDLTDPATLGCLLALVREAHKEATIHTVGWFSEWDDQVMWHVVSGKEDRGLATEETEAEALVAALEAA